MFYVEKTKLSGVLKKFIRKYIFRKQSHCKVSLRGGSYYLMIVKIILGETLATSRKF